MNRRLMIFAALIGTASMMPAFAQDSLVPGGLKAVDTDGDGAISSTEATAALQKQFAMLDRNHDGMVSEDEFVAARMEQFGKADADGDGKLTRSEIRQHMLAMRPR